jgi:hypothetical protein
MLSTMTRGLTALVIAALALTTMRAANVGFTTGAERSHATLSTAHRVHVDPPSNPAGVVAIVAVVAAVLFALGGVVEAPVVVWPRRRSPIRRRGPPSSS